MVSGPPHVPPPFFVAVRRHMRRAKNPFKEGKKPADSSCICVLNLSLLSDLLLLLLLLPINVAAVIGIQYICCVFFGVTRLGIKRMASLVNVKCLPGSGVVFLEIQV